MKTWTVFLGVCGLAAILPLLSGYFAGSGSSSADFPGWTNKWRGVELRRIPLTWREQRFAEGFPGQIAQFTDGRRLLVMRYTARATRKLHGAADCFRGAGYRIRPLPLYTDEVGDRWGSFEASKDGEQLVVRERIFENSGRAWTDASSWFWHAAFGRTDGPWWAVTTVERALPPGRAKSPRSTEPSWTEESTVAPVL
jgi:hypothetical protein